MKAAIFHGTERTGAAKKMGGMMIFLSRWATPLAAFAFLSALAGEARGGEVPERKETSGGVTLTWSLAELSTRPKVTQRALIVRLEGKPRGAMLLFPGGPDAGCVKIRENGGYRSCRNFLVRSAHLFALAGFAGVIVDAPSDYSSGMSDDHRNSKEHIKDVTAIVDHLAKQGYKNIQLVGTSRGTFSVAYLAAAMKDQRVKGVVLTSSMNDIAFLPLKEIQYPVLFVHHIGDECRVTEPASALWNFKSLAKSPRKHFLTVSGGDPPISRACRALSEHGYLGIEKKVVDAIAEWSAGKPIPEKIQD